MLPLPRRPPALGVGDRRAEHTNPGDELRKSLLRSSRCSLLEGQSHGNEVDGKENHIFNKGSTDQ